MQEQKTEILRVEHLKKYFTTPKGTLHAVDDVNFSIRTGETLGVVGESGCGKSTMGRAILRLHEPTSGKVYFEGKDILGYNKKQLKDLRKDMQIIFQDPFASLNPRMTVSEAIIEPLLVQGIYKPNEKAAITQQVEKIMNLVGLAKRLVNTYPHELDGGRRQRIGIARALAVNPKFIVCDEPVSALDVSIQAQIINLLAQLQRELELTVLFISHDLRVVRHITHRVMVMYLGSNVEVGPTEAIFQHPAHPYTQVLTKAAPKLDPLNRQRDYAIEGEPPSPIHTPTGCKFHPRCPYCTDKCRSEVPELKEIAPGHLCACHYPL